MEAVTVSLQHGLGGGAFGAGKFATGKFGGGEWIEMITEVRSSEPIVLEYGIRSSDPSQLVAETGALSYALNNGDWNANHTAGWYSPLHAMRRGGFDFNIPTKLALTSAGVTQYKFNGRLADILVTPGEREDRMTRCMALDLMDEYARLPVPPIDAQFDKRGDQLIQTLLDSMPTEIRPALTSIETGIGTYGISMDQAREETLTIRDVMIDIARSEMASVYFVGTSAPDGGLFVFRNRQNAAINTIVFHHFENDIARNGLAVPGSRDDIISKVQVIAHPNRVDAGDVVMYSLENSSTLVAPGQTITYIAGPYRDSDNPGERIGGFDMLQPVAVTDYLMNNQQDGSGVDMTGNFIVSADYFGTTAYFHITNAGPAHAYVTKLQARGKGIYRSDAVVEHVVPDVPTGQSAMQIDMTYLSDTNVAADVASYLAQSLSRIYARVNSVTFLANLNPTLMNAMLVLEPGDRIAITEAQTGIEDAEFLINGVRLEILPGAGESGGFLVWCTWYLKPADTQKYWFMGIAGASELGVSTVLGY